MNIEFSYGFMGYVMRYIAWPFLLIFSVVFVAIPILMIATSVWEKLPMQFTFLLVISVPMSAFMAKGAYYCFRYSHLFTKKFLFSGDGIVDVIDPDGTDRVRFQIERVTYRRALKMFELHSHDDQIVVMNNGKHETREFLLLKEHLLQWPGAVVKWF